MFRAFPNNYVWNLSANIALNTGGLIDEVVRICDSLVDASELGDDDGTEQFFRAWCDMADKLRARAERADSAGHPLSASDFYLRSWVYYQTAERMQSRSYAPRWEAYKLGLDSMHRAIDVGDVNAELVEVPYEGVTLPAYLVKARGVDKAPVMVFYNGLDSTKEMVIGGGIGDQFARRGISVLVVDHPGSGEALRLRGLTGYHDSERWSAPVIDYLETRSDVDADRIGVVAWSLGGYYAPRAAAFEKRFKLCVAWGANYNWGELQKRRLAKEGDRPVPHYWDHVQWVFGKESLEEFMEFAPLMTLEGVVEKIDVPFLITHGDLDTQIPREYAYAQYEAAVNSPVRQLKFFTAEEGGAMHASADNLPVAASFISDWVSDHL
ncbi:alpha/beta hydrolase [Rhodococcus sp. 06-462-5]|uniref:alpha/beta hydrolase family protein n=1 Tax=unclassified Rhodococcus (in: high G+C Gram-positive bacteria) TaxID=192944 RepID=UPI000B9C00CB|nr:MULTISPECIES: alpha/beta fold hydrolase [unclassified Rhodococcus (in: high G+C Gram-positive bacteria)]OZC77221.1 alpha/beta hydrolase [Rhodococcus sp. 06-462-5]OZE63378.1 alpha/beta hydrolase [Rhodococcus sp. 02-925g]